MNLTAAVTGGDERAIIDAAETGEDSARSAYERALERQYAVVRQALDRVRDLKRAA